jgi:hypothetical protein
MAGAANSRGVRDWSTLLGMTRCLTAALLLATSTAVAQNPAIDKVRADPGFHQTAEKFFRNYESRLSTHCATVDPAWSLAKAKVYGQPTLGANGGIVNATWVETVPGTACGTSRRYRVLVAIRNGNATVEPLLPGDSFASPQLEQDAVNPLAKATAEFVPKGQKCAVDVLDTRLVGDAPTQSKQPWNEMWTVATCNRKLNVPIQFVPDMVGEGTAIKIESKAVLVAP